MADLFRKPKPIQDLLDDPQYLHRVWRLMGASEMVAHYMQNYGDEKMKDMGVRLADIVDWFYTMGPSDKP